MQINGSIIQKSKNDNLFSRKYFIHIKFDKVYNMRISEELYKNFVIGTRVTCICEQVPEGMRSLYLV